MQTQSNDKVQRIIAALETAEILGVNDYLLHSWDILPDEDIVLAFSYTDHEGQIYEFKFNEEALENAVFFLGGLSLKDNKGETVDIQLYKLNLATIKPSCIQKIFGDINMQTKPQFELILPDGEFTMKDLVRQTGKKQPFLHIKLTKLLAAGKVTVIREERGHIGRAAKVYKKT